MNNVIKTKKTRQRKRNTSSMTAKPKELNMSKLESDESVQNSESEDQYSMAEPAARFLLRALILFMSMMRWITMPRGENSRPSVREDPPISDKPG